MNEETKAPSLITKWVETKDYRVVIVSPSHLQEFYMNLTDYPLLLLQDPGGRFG